MEDSTEENAKSSGLARLHEMVMEVKSDKEVGMAYMKSFEVERHIRREERILWIYWKISVLFRMS